MLDNFPHYAGKGLILQFGGRNPNACNLLRGFAGYFADRHADLKFEMRKNMMDGAGQ
jgi:hypothetical protein